MSDNQHIPEPENKDNSAEKQKTILKEAADLIMEGLRMGASWLSAEWIWIQHGRPFREMNDVNHLYYQVCSKCEFFLNDGCMICRCRLVPNELSALNKLSMATTNCPLPQPKWISAITPPDDLAPEIAETALRNAKVHFVEVTETEQPSGDQPLMTVSEIKKKQAAAEGANPFIRTATGQYVEGERE
ncbi:MAG TPA: hypothetical protein DEB39_00570 [Planctomycetaceae bacterium]|nr:hypothetical protein [Planctomycetaceae bacterium]